MDNPRRYVRSADSSFRLSGSQSCTEAEFVDLRKEAFISALSWVEEEGASLYVGGEKNRLVRRVKGWPLTRADFVLCVAERNTSALQPHGYAFRRDYGAFLPADHSQSVYEEEHVEQDWAHIFELQIC